MNILLIEAPWPSHLADGSSRSLPPLGLGYLVSALEQAGHSCRVINPDEDNTTHFCEMTSTQMDLSKIDLFGISSTTDSFLGCCKIAKNIKDNFPHIPIVLGGVHATIVGGDIILNELSGVFDYVLEGEGEYSLPMLAESVIRPNKEMLLKIDGLCYYDNGVIRKNPRKLISDLDLLCFPNRNAIRQPEESVYSVYGKDVTMITSRGCSHNCSFCSVSSFYGHTWRFRSIENVLFEIEDIVSQYGEKFFLHFIDDNFFVDAKRAFMIINKAHSRWPNIKYSFATRSDQVIRNEMYLKGMAELGVVSVELGIENGSQRVLMRYNKKTTVAQNEAALKILKKLKIEAAIDYIFFDHYTDIEDIKDNIQFLKRTGLWGYYPPVVFSSLTLYRGTDIAREWEKNEGETVGIYKGEEIRFKYQSTSRIYSVIQTFSQYLPRLYSILKECQKAENNGGKGISTYRLVYKQLSLMPYKLVEDLYTLEMESKDIDSEGLINSLVNKIDKCEKLIRSL